MMKRAARSRGALVGALATIVLFIITGCGNDPAGPEEPVLVGVWSIGDNPQVWGLIAGRFRRHNPVMVVRTVPSTTSRSIGIVAIPGWTEVGYT